MKFRFLNFIVQCGLFSGRFLALFALMIGCGTCRWKGMTDPTCQEYFIQSARPEWPSGKLQRRGRHCMSQKSLKTWVVSSFVFSILHFTCVAFPNIFTSSFKR